MLQAFMETTESPFFVSTITFFRGNMEASTTTLNATLNRYDGVNYITLTVPEFAIYIAVGLMLCSFLANVVLTRLICRKKKVKVPKYVKEAKSCDAEYSELTMDESGPSDKRYIKDPTGVSGERSRSDTCSMEYEYVIGTVTQEVDRSDYRTSGTKIYDYVDANQIKKLTRTKLLTTQNDADMQENETMYENPNLYTNTRQLVPTKQTLRRQINEPRERPNSKSMEPNNASDELDNLARNKGLEENQGPCSHSFTTESSEHESLYLNNTSLSASQHSVYVEYTSDGNDIYENFDQYRADESSPDNSPPSTMTAKGNVNVCNAKHVNLQVTYTYNVNSTLP